MKQMNIQSLKECDRDVIYPIYEGQKVDAEICETLGFDLNTIVDSKLNKVTKVHTLGRYSFSAFIFIGLGKVEDMTTKKMRTAFAQVSKEICQPSVFYVAPAVTEAIDLHQVTELFVETYYLSTYKEVKINGQANIIPDVDIFAGVDVSESIVKALNMALGINHARDLGNCPANIMTPKRMVKVAKMLAKTYHLDCQILDKKALEEMGAGGILSVSQGSKQKPYMIVLKYSGDKEDVPYTALIGKGITFDSGGYNLKPNSYGMKYDMCGAASVLGAIEIIAANQMKANVYAIVPVSENLVNGQAYKPQDVITTLSKKTVEIVSTDAEGRLILCDAITYAQQLGAKYLVDIATLTGACVVALGGAYTGVFSNNDAFYQRLEASFEKSDEAGWRLPTGQAYLDMIQSNSADLKNSSGQRGGGASVAASFLESFVEKDVAWIHLDIAGMADNAQGATGVMIRSLVNLF